MEWRPHLIEVTKTFNPAEAELFASLETPEHLAVVSHIPPELAAELSAYANELSTVEPSLLMVSPSAYHITVAAVPAETNVDSLRRLTERALQGGIQLDMFGVFMHPLVMAVAAIPYGLDLYKVRQEILEGVGQPVPSGRQGELGWVSLARFAGRPGKALVALALREVSREWGSMLLDSATIYRSRNKHLLHAIPVAKIKAQ